MKNMQIWNKELKLSSFAVNIILYQENSKESSKHLLDIIISNVLGCKLSTEILIVFLLLIILKNETKKITPFQYLQKKDN